MARAVLGTKLKVIINKEVYDASRASFQGLFREKSGPAPCERQLARATWLPHGAGRIWLALRGSRTVRVALSPRPEARSPGRRRAPRGTRRHRCTRARTPATGA